MRCVMDTNALMEGFSPGIPGVPHVFLPSFIFVLFMPSITKMFHDFSFE